ncbi:hypothetical protein E3N88_34858 [Mikania micrantha]|uniref:Uncharacterized protein n=1 Tax=Mikania micrantha TaxID=192012 RepID=A0A5N6LZH1_9ASTR|nr:hypothetical protein E3N88_34858 [Mikania micrantha]
MGRRGGLDGKREERQRERDERRREIPVDWAAGRPAVGEWLRGRDGQVSGGAVTILYFLASYTYSTATAQFFTLMAIVSAAVSSPDTAGKTKSCLARKLFLPPFSHRIWIIGGRNHHHRSYHRHQWFGKGLDIIATSGLGSVGWYGLVSTWSYGIGVSYGLPIASLYLVLWLFCSQLVPGKADLQDCGTKICHGRPITWPAWPVPIMGVTCRLACAAWQEGCGS